MMAPTMVAHPARNGHAAPSILHVVPALGGRVDQLLELRRLLKDAQEAERTLTREIAETMQSQGLRALQGTRAVAVLDSRTTWTVDPALFIEALGPAAFAAVTVSVTAARRLMAADDLAAISETTSLPVLRVEPLVLGPAAA